MTSHDDTGPRPVFVVGMNGSGTTMLLDCLDNHPNLFGFRRETRLLPYVIASLPKYGDLTVDANYRRLWRDVLRLSAFRYMNGGVAPPLPDDWERGPRGVATVIDGVFRGFAARAGKHRWCEKTPMHALHIERFAALFPHAKFIHMVRDGRSCAASFHRRWRYTPELTMYRWKNVVREGRRQGRRIGERYTEVSYEELVRDPAAGMAAVCEFLDEPYTDEVLTLSRTRTITGSTDRNITARAPRWTTYFDPAQRHRLERIGGRTLADTGYPTDYPRDDYDPSWLARKLWLARDYVRMGLFSMQEVEEPFTRTMTALKQRVTTRY